jgi:hypothetical protein
MGIPIGKEGEPLKQKGCRAKRQAGDQKYLIFRIPRQKNKVTEKKK